MDKNGDQKLSNREIKDYLHANPDEKAFLCGADFAAMGTGHWQDFFKSLDADGDSIKTKEEFVAFYLKQAEQL